ncbi:Muskelin 1, intracellular mediator containing kelch motif, partial [Podila clonocystis]
NLVDLSSDFWRFEIDPKSPPFGSWTKICANTAVLNGPELIFDHQMCLDPLSQTLYVFGGRVVQLDNDIEHYSGLYSYHIPTNFWKLLRAEGHSPPNQDGTTVLHSRIGHSMLYDEMMHSLVIFAGQRNKDYLSDFYVYDIAADRVLEVCKDYSKQGGPEAGFTQRATISSRGREVYVLSGLVKDRGLSAEKLKNSFWVFRLPGQNQMDAIRDVQHALKNARSTGSIGSLKIIMNHGRSLSEQYDQESGDGPSPSSSSRPSTSRRKIHNEKNPGEPGTRLRRGIARPESSSDSLIANSSLANKDGASRNVPIQNAMDNIRRPNMRGRLEGSGEAGGTSEPGASSSSSIKSPTSTSLPLSSAGTIHSTSSARRQAPSPASPVNEPMTLAYVLSDKESWQKIFQNSNLELGEPSEPEPMPRYAHQLVYDDVNEVQYLFGGNPAQQGNPSSRLDDFWELRLYRPKPDQIVRKAKYLIRTQQFKELCQRPNTSILTSTTVASPTLTGPATHVPVSEKAAHHRTNRRISSTSSGWTGNQGGQALGGLIERGTLAHHEQPMRALRFLQTELSCVVDQTNKVESEDFKALLHGLSVNAFSPSTGISSAASVLGNGSSSSTGSRNSHSGDSLGNPQKTTEILLPSTVTSPSLSNAQMLMSSPSDLSSFAANSETHQPGLPAFRASPSGNQLSIPTFDDRHGNGEEDNDNVVDVNDDQLTPGNVQDNDAMGRREDEDSPMLDSSMVSRRLVHGTGGISGGQAVAVASRRVVTSSNDLSDPESLDNNGDLVKPALTKGSKKRHDMDNLVMVDSDRREECEDEEENQSEDDDHDDENDEEETYANEEEEQAMKMFYSDRTILYEKLLEFIAEDMKQPKGDLVDLVKVE